jgi:hypothetical protein
VKVNPHWQFVGKLDVDTLQLWTLALDEDSKLVNEYLCFFEANIAGWDHYRHGLDSMIPHLQD